MLRTGGALGGYTGVSEPLPDHAAYVGLGEVRVRYLLTPAVTQAQLRRLAGAYLRATPHRPCRVRFDVVTVLWPRRGDPRVEHLEGVL